jgi:hypothetical protein
VGHAQPLSNLVGYCAAVNAVDLNLAVPHGNLQPFQFLVPQHQVPDGSFVRKIDPNVSKRQKKKSRTYGTKLQRAEYREARQDQGVGKCEGK